MLTSENKWDIQARNQLFFTVSVTIKRCQSKTGCRRAKIQRHPWRTSVDQNMDKMWLFRDKMSTWQYKHRLSSSANLANPPFVAHLWCYPTSQLLFLPFPYSNSTGITFAFVSQLKDKNKPLVFSPEGYQTILLMHLSTFTLSLLCCEICYFLPERKDQHK